MTHGRTASGRTLARRLVAEGLARIRPLLAELAGGSGDVEPIHQLRVALRQLRTALKLLRPFCGDMSKDGGPALASLFDALGELRDRQVFLATIAPGLRHAAAGLADPCAALAPIDGARAVALSREPALAQALAGLESFSRGHDEEDGDAPADRWIRRQLGRLERRTTRAGRSYAALPFDQQHRLRKRLKQWRYLAQVVAPRAGLAAQDGWARRADEALAALGRHMDLCQAVKALQAVAAQRPEAWFAVGWLHAQQAQAAALAQRRLERLARRRPR